MYATRIAQQLRRKGHDVMAVGEVEDLAGRSDVEVFSAAAAERRAIVTNNVDGYMRLVDAALEEGTDHAGLLFTSDRSLPRSRSAVGRFVRVVDKMLRENPSDDALRKQIRWLP
jgi:uncharacterized protein DUF5615